MCLMGMIFIVIIVLIILSALGLDKGKFNVPDEVRNVAKTNSTLLLL
jgi:SNARE protein